jgi:hypothetical protein
MRHDLTNATFIIPVRIETDDRLRNVITTTAFLLENFDTNIIIKEVDKESNVVKHAIPILKEIVDVEVNIKHIFEKSENSSFHRQKILNEMLVETNTDVIINYDCDVILPINSYITSYNQILNKKYDIIYPYGQGNYQKQVNVDDEIVSEFLETGDYSVLDKKSNIHTSDFGWAQFFNRQVYIDGFMENENFVAYAPEDKERFYRFSTLGYNIGRIQNFVYHLEHARSENSWTHNPYMESNNYEWMKLSKMNKEELIEYYSNQKYLKKYVSI